MCYWHVWWLSIGLRYLLANLGSAAPVLHVLTAEENPQNRQANQGRGAKRSTKRCKVLLYLAAVCLPSTFNPCYFPLLRGQCTVDMPNVPRQTHGREGTCSIPQLFHHAPRVLGAFRH